MITLALKEKKDSVTIVLPASKSLTNRLQILKAFNNEIEISNFSGANDCRVLQAALDNYFSGKENLDIEDAGTAGRFLLAFAAIGKRSVIIDGTARMRKRPYDELINALCQSGASIECLDVQGCLPVRIQPAKIKGGIIKVNGSTSSQFISALMLIAPYIKGGLRIEFEKLVSRPYVDMTAGIIQEAGGRIEIGENFISVQEGKYIKRNFVVENDWSAASYFYLMAALSGIRISLPGLRKYSLQGDSIIAELFSGLGIDTVYSASGVELQLKNTQQSFGLFEYDFTDCPDLVMTIAVFCVAKKVPARLKGVRNLRLKESDRLSALKNELEKMNCRVSITEDELVIDDFKSFPDTVQFATYNDHRLAMSLSMFVFCGVTVKMENEDVVKKSFPGFFVELGKGGLVTIDLEVEE